MDLAGSVDAVGVDARDAENPAPRFDEHESGQFRLAVPGEQVSLLPLPDSLIPCLRDAETLDNPPPTPVHYSHDSHPQAETLPL